MFIHYNMRYDWMRPSTEEIVAAYIKTYGADPHESDAEFDSESDSASDVEGSDGEYFLDKHACRVSVTTQGTKKLRACSIVLIVLVVPFIHQVLFIRLLILFIHPRAPCRLQASWSLSFQRLHPGSRLQAPEEPKAPYNSKLQAPDPVRAPHGSRPQALGGDKAPGSWKSSMCAMGWEGCGSP